MSYYIEDGLVVQNAESIGHLLLHYPVAKYIWGVVRCDFNI
jgi:hypothetical protein